MMRTVNGMEVETVVQFWNQKNLLLVKQITSVPAFYGEGKWTVSGVGYHP